MIFIICVSLYICTIYIFFKLIYSLIPLIIWLAQLQPQCIGPQISHPPFVPSQLTDAFSWEQRSSSIDTMDLFLNRSSLQDEKKKQPLKTRNMCKHPRHGRWRASPERYTCLVLCLWCRAFCKTSRWEVAGKKRPIHVRMWLMNHLPVALKEVQSGGFRCNFATACSFLLVWRLQLDYNKIMTFPCRFPNPLVVTQKEKERRKQISLKYVNIDFFFFNCCLRLYFLCEEIADWGLQLSSVMPRRGLIIKPLLSDSRLTCSCIPPLDSLLLGGAVSTVNLPISLWPLQDF